MQPFFRESLDGDSLVAGKEIEVAEYHLPYILVNETRKEDGKKEMNHHQDDL